MLELVTPEQAAKLAELAASLKTAVAESGRSSRQTLFLRPEEGKPLKDAPQAPRASSRRSLPSCKLGAARRSRQQVEQLEKHWQASEPDLRRAAEEARAAAIEARDDCSRSIPRVMVMEDMPKPRETFMLVRGSYEKPTER